MRVLYTTMRPASESARAGGIGLFATLFARHMAHAGMHATGLVLSAPTHRRHANTTENISPDLFSYTLPADPYQMLQDWNEHHPPDALLNLVPSVAKALKTHKPDVVFLIGFGIEQWLIAQAATLRGIPYVISHHGILAAEVGRSGFESYPPGAHWLLYAMEKEASEGAAVRIFLNDWSRRQFGLMHDIKSRPRSRIIPIPYNEVYSHPAPPPSHGWHRPTMNVGWVARWDRIKRPRIVAQIAGASPKRWRWEAITTIRETGSVAEATRKLFLRRVRVHTPMPPAALANWYVRMDALILPSAFDVSPTVVLEAALRGRLTVLSHHTGWTDAYHEAGLDHLLCDSTPSAMLAALEAARDDREGALRLREFLRETHAPARVFAAHAKAFRDALS